MRRDVDAPRLIVFGSTGYIGRALAAAAPAALPLPGTVARSSQMLRASLSEAPPGAVVVHAAGTVASRDHTSDRRAYVDSTKRLFDAIAAVEAPLRVLTLGSIAETLPDTGAYASAKRTQRTVAHEASDRLGVPWRHLLIHNVIGPSLHATLAPGALARQLRHVAAAGGRTLSIRNAAAVRDYLDVRDLATRIVSLSYRFDELDRDRPVEVCSGIGRSVHEIATALVAASGAAIDVVALPSSDDICRVVGDSAPLRTVLGAAALMTIDFETSVTDLWQSAVHFPSRETA
jgi:nucleoside-diphosphate-sugar epimerase